MNAKRHLLRRKAGDDSTNQLRRENLRESGARDKRGRHHRNNDGESFLRVPLALFRQKPRIDGNECDRSCAARDDVVEKVGQGERRAIGVDQLSRAKRVGDVSLADVSDHARERDGSHQQQCRREGGVLVRRTEEAQQTHPSQINAFGGCWESYRRCGIGNGNLPA